MDWIKRYTVKNYLGYFLVMGAIKDKYKEDIVSLIKEQIADEPQVILGLALSLFNGGFSIRIAGEDYTEEHISEKAAYFLITDIVREKDSVFKVCGNFVYMDGQEEFIQRMFDRNKEIDSRNRANYLIACDKLKELGIPRSPWMNYEKA